MQRETTHGSIDSADTVPSRSLSGFHAYLDWAMPKTMRAPFSQPLIP